MCIDMCIDMFIDTMSFLEVTRARTCTVYPLAACVPRVHAYACWHTYAILIHVCARTHARTHRV